MRTTVIWMGRTLAQLNEPELDALLVQIAWGRRVAREVHGGAYDGEFDIDEDLTRLEIAKRAGQIH